MGKGGIKTILQSNKIISFPELRDSLRRSLSQFYNTDKATRGGILGSSQVVNPVWFNSYYKLPGLKSHSSLIALVYPIQTSSTETGDTHSHSLADTLRGKHLA